MVEETLTGEQVPEETPGEAASTETSKVNLHIYMTADGYERVKKFAEYAAVEGVIEGTPEGTSATTATSASISARVISGNIC